LSSNTKFFGLVGERNSVGFTAAPNVQDAINPATDNYASRRVDRDFYKNLGIENRNILEYTLGKTRHNLAFGVRLYKAKTTRQQEGKGTNESNFDLGIEGDYPRDLDFNTENVALFAENQFRVTENFSVTPGIRYEHITSTGEGRFGISGGNAVAFPEKTLVRNKTLFGLGLEYKFRTASLYANITQAYRPVLFSDLTPAAVTDVIDPDLKDASGFNADLGFRGSFKKYLNFDFSLFYLSYNNRIGGVRQFVNNDPAQGTFLFRTNLGETVNKGIEGFFNLNATQLLEMKEQYGSLDFFASVSFIDSRYTDFKTYASSGAAPSITITESNLSGNRVENAPRYIHSFGLSWSNSQFSSTLQYRMSGKIFTDANNTVSPSANGVTGLLDKYSVFDLSSEYKFLRNYNIRAGINNLFNEKYATRRAGGYPGPGILPGEGQTFYISIGAKI
ncbi:MAG TPA: TonB-dependent receptor, partial [Flavobacterium sp.]|nr:TonB-dependent receptor [Flavobacterium sp.]